jgi:translation initiation factor 2 subunit 3
MGKSKKDKGKNENISAEDLGIVKSTSPPSKTTEEVEQKVVETEESDQPPIQVAPPLKILTKEEREKIKKETKFVQSSTNVGTVGHVDHGKTTLVKALSGIWTERYAEELTRGITIKLGYSEAEIVKCPKCGSLWTMHLANILKQKKAIRGTCPNDGEKLDFQRRISFVDAPGHEILMATMLSGASLMDGAILLISAVEKCPQPQTREHLAALEIAKIEKIIIVQNKVDAVSKEKALENFREIKQFIKGSIAENAPIIPVSAVFNANVDYVASKIEEMIPPPEFDADADFLFNVARSFDVDKPGTDIEILVGGVIGGSVIQGEIFIGDQIEIRPGIRNEKGTYTPIITTVRSIYEGSNSLEFARPGGLIALGTELDPSVCRSDQLIGNVAGKPGTLPLTINSVRVEIHLLERMLGSEENIGVDPIKKSEVLMLVVGTMTSAGVVASIEKKNIIELNLKRPICASSGAITAISRRFKNRFRLIGYGYIQ